MSCCACVVVAVGIAVRCLVLAFIINVTGRLLPQTITLGMPWGLGATHGPSLGITRVCFNAFSLAGCCFFFWLSELASVRLVAQQGARSVFHMGELMVY